MRTCEKMMIGGLGALTPILMNLLIVDLKVLLIQLTLFAILGYSVRVIVLFFIGGLWAYLHKEENNLLKIFQLGIVAPALITASINAGNVETPKVIAQNNEIFNAPYVFIPSAYAQPAEKEELKRFSPSKETLIQQFWRGLIGASSERVWFVVAGTHLKLEDAKKQAQEINQKEKDFKAEVYEPYGEDLYYSVVIGENLTYEQALR
ncbi:MAG: hypothetical protein ACFFDN_18285, partial [Candidatus Hodarchaeota archaeon]